MVGFGPAHAAEISREVDKLEREHLDVHLAAVVKRARAVVCRLEGRFDEARRLTEEVVGELEALGMLTRAASHNESLARIELDAGRVPQALVALERGDRVLAQQGDRAHRSTIQAYLADVHERLNDRVAAYAAIALSDQLTAADDVVNFAITHAVRARLALSAMS